MDKITIDIVAVAYLRFGELRVFVQSILNQSAKNWRLTVIHDGPNQEFDMIMEGFRNEKPESISYFSSAYRNNDYGHSLRAMGIDNVTADYLLSTNSDNYFIPRALEFISDAFERAGADVVLYDMVHSHQMPRGQLLPEYSYVNTVYARGSIDISATAVRATISKAVGFRDRTHDGDCAYFEDCARAVSPATLRAAKINRVLLVHN